MIKMPRRSVFEWASWPHYIPTLGTRKILTVIHCLGDHQLIITFCNKWHSKFLPWAQMYCYQYLASANRFLLSDSFGVISS